jgi:ribonuclease PH
VQATAEHRVYDDEQLQAMITLARAGIRDLLEKQQAAIGKLSMPAR